MDGPQHWPLLLRRKYVKASSVRCWLTRHFGSACIAGGQRVSVVRTNRGDARITAAIISLSDTSHSGTSGMQRQQLLAAKSSDNGFPATAHIRAPVRPGRARGQNLRGCCVDRHGENAGSIRLGKADVHNLHLGESYAGCFASFSKIAAFLGGRERRPCPAASGCSCHGVSIRGYAHFLPCCQKVSR